MEKTLAVHGSAMVSWIGNRLYVAYALNLALTFTGKER